MKFERSGGILLHPTSLPGPYGIGDLGPQAYRFVDWLASTGCKLWQVLPLGPTGYGDSPYQCFSAFAGNPYLIGFDALIEDGLLTTNDFADMPNFSASRVDPSTRLRVNFGLLIPWKLNLLERAYSRFVALSGATAGRVGGGFRYATNATQPPPSYRDQGSAVKGPVLSNVEGLYSEFNFFSAENAAWLDDYALFMSLKEANGGGAWNNWNESIRKRKKSAMDKARKEHAESVRRHSFYQFLFFRQWNKLRAYANERDIKIIGDIPIFIAYDSADAWANPDLFFLDEDSLPTVVAGVPPDYFSPTGQLWGNPLYRWDAHKETGYAWWLERFRAVLKTVDIVRLDHFRGFAGYFEIQFGQPTAEHGRWVPGPGSDFFKAMDAHLSDGLATPQIELPIIAEDLGLITADVVTLRDEFRLPGMKILQFGFVSPKDPFLPHNYPANCVAYTGTHDNDTALGWFDSAPEEEREFALRYLDIQPCEGSEPSQGFAWELIRAVWSSVAVYAITPMQDLLSLGTEARMNFPSRLGGNWEWRIKEEDMSEALAKRLGEFNELYLR
ncbi:MAG: 4-alpha-glucanotransferase [Anaerolineae bacterium]|nr:4-alpha-glucanotransferase [Anaerolineae bacterium]MCI0609786.1 4-alpha-glucanotransferase [Anaerolineae bacterium]